MPSEVKLSKPEAELLIRRTWDECARKGKVCPRGCGNIDKPCIKIERRVGKKLMKILGWKED